MLYDPRFTHGSSSHSIGFVVSDKSFLDWIELEFPFENPGDGRCVAGDMRLASDVGVRRGLGTAFHAIEKVPNVLRWKRAWFAGRR
jgi:hypothetical protein